MVCYKNTQFPAYAPQNHITTLKIIQAAILLPVNDPAEGLVYKCKNPAITGFLCL